jgi:hypothetical protein
MIDKFSLVYRKSLSMEETVIKFNTYKAVVPSMSTINDFLLLPTLSLALYSLYKGGTMDFASENCFDLTSLLSKL